MVRKRVLLLGVLLCLSAYAVFAQTDTTLPSQPQTTSIQSLLDGIASLKSQMADLTAHDNEFRAQQQASMKLFYQNLLLYCTILVVLVIAVSRMIGRIYNWLMARRWGARSKRDMVLLNEKVDLAMYKVDEGRSVMESMLVQLVTLGGVLGSMNASVEGVPEEMLKLKAEVERIKTSKPGASLFTPPASVVEKKGFWLFNLFKRKPKEESSTGSDDGLSEVAGFVEHKTMVVSEQQTPPMVQTSSLSQRVQIQEITPSPARAEPSPTSPVVGGSASMDAMGAFMEDWFNKKLGSMQQGSLGGAPVRRSAGRPPARKTVRKPVVRDKTKLAEIQTPADGLGVIEQAKNGRYFIKGHQGIVADTKVDELLSSGKWKVVQRL